MTKKKEKQQVKPVDKVVISPLAFRNELNKLSREDLFIRISNLDEDDRKKAWTLLSDAKCAEIIEDSGSPVEWFLEMSTKKESGVISVMDEEKATDLLSLLDQEKRVMVMEMSGKSFQKRLRYSPDEVGSIMSEDFILLEKSTTVKDAFEKIREEAEGKDNIRTIFLTDKGEGLYGEVDLLDILRSPGDQTLSSVATTSFPYVSASAKLSKTLEWIKDYNLSSFPVIDEEGKTIGAVTRQSLMDIVEREMEEDYRKLASIGEDKNMGVISSMKARLPWLFILLGLGIIVSSSIGFLSSLAMGLAMVFSFQSLILDMTGNSGTQTLAVAVRALSGRDLSWKEKLTMLKKESASGFISGLILGLGAILVLFPYILLRSGNGALYSLALSVCISLSLILAMTLSNTSGAFIPIVMEKIGVDPAVASGPLITTLSDLIGASSYYTLAYLVLKKVFHY